MSPMFCRAFMALALCSAVPCAAQPDVKPSVPMVSAGEIVWWADFAPAEEVGVTDIWIWLPESYRSEAERSYPVLYMHDAENIFDRRLSGFDKEWRVDETITRMARAGDLREWIVVGLRSPSDRYQTLFPQKLFKYLPEEYRQSIKSIEFPGIEQGIPLSGDRYAAMLAKSLKPAIDNEFRTLTGAKDTAVMGSSMGGLMSLYAIGEYPEIFGQAAGLSTHLPLSSPEWGDAEIRAGQVAEAFRFYLASSRLNPEINRVYIDHGTGTLDSYYPPYAKAFDSMMKGHGWSDPSYMSRAFLGAEHEEISWSQRLDIPLMFLDRSDP